MRWDSTGADILKSCINALISIAKQRRPTSYCSVKHKQRKSNHLHSHLLAMLKIKHTFFHQHRYIFSIELWGFEGIVNSKINSVVIYSTFLSQTKHKNIFLNNFLSLQWKSVWSKNNNGNKPWTFFKIYIYIFFEFHRRNKVMQV